jgi:hypothetical protein
LQVFDNGATVLTHFDAKGTILGRTCSGDCDGVKVGPISCPEGQSPVLDCTANPPTLTCEDRSSATASVPRVGPQEKSKKNSPVVKKASSRKRKAKVATEASVCYYNDKEYSDGAFICASHALLKCADGSWVDQNQFCE